MDKLDRDKKKLRNDIKEQKSKYSNSEFKTKSDEILTNVEVLGVFQQSKNILCYNAMEGEVQTIDFMNKWMVEKNFYLPVIIGEKMVFRSYNKQTKFEESSFKVLEPLGNNLDKFDNIDLVIVPGVAFDRKKNRLGYGKGFYDKFLQDKLNIPRLGICFEFQLVNSLPIDKYDIPMNYIVSENEIIW